MPAFQTDTPRKPQKLFELAITAPQPFTSGHVLTADEAGFVNSQVAARVANSYAGTMRKAHADALKALLADAVTAWTEGGKKGKEPTYDSIIKANPGVTIDSVTASWPHQAKFDALYADYTLAASVRGTGEDAKTPLDRMIDFLAKERAKANILAKGHKVAVFMKTKTKDDPEVSMFTALVAKVKAAYADELKEQAQAQLDAQSADTDEADDLFDGLELPADSDEEQAAA